MSSLGRRRAFAGVHLPTRLGSRANRCKPFVQNEMRVLESKNSFNPSIGVR
jgi:hypothetical protein